MRKETCSLAPGRDGLFGAGSAGFVVAALNAASAASREVVVRRVLSIGISCPPAKASLPRYYIIETCDRLGDLRKAPGQVIAGPAVELGRARRLCGHEAKA